MADATRPSESKALRLARYLKEFVGLRATTVHDIDKYEQVLWFGDMPHEAECDSPAWNHDSERSGPWLEVHKQQFPPRPPAPDIILSWIDQRALSRPAAEMPRLRRADGAHLPAEVTGAYEHYRPIWEMWAKEHQRRSRIQSVYAELFRMHTQMQKQGEILELVLGFGLLSWRRPAGTSGAANSPAILRHMVTAQVDLTFDATTGTIRLDCGPDGARLQIEDDMLDDALRPAPAHHAAVAEQLRALGDDVWNRNIIRALKSWTAALHPDAEWSADLKMVTARDSRPVVSYAPALIMRNRAQAGMVRIYDTLIDRLSKDGDAMPSGWRGLVDVAANAEAASPPADEAPGSPAGALGEVYFPLPANREQRRIIDVISSDRSVLVQGPPGTGKSHTIANLVCHLLASGKRVLITAETGRALKVLKEKLPEEVRPLCISLLRQGGDAFAELNAAVQGITTRYASWHERAYDARIADVDRELEANRRTIAEIDRELRSLREGETVSHSLMNGLYAGTASEIAQKVAAERDRWGWLHLPQNAPDDPPVTGAEMATWLRIRRTYDHDAIAAAKLRVVGTNELPSPADFGAAVTAESDAKAAFEGDAARRDHPAYAAIAALTEDDREALAAKLRELKESREALQRRGDRRLQDALRAALDGRQAGWLALLEQSQQTLEEIEQLLQRLGSHAISIPESWDLKQVRADLVIVYRHLREGGKWVEFGLYTPKAIKSRLYLRGPLTVDGQVADTAERLRLVCDHIDFVLSLQALDLAWSDYGGLPPGSLPRIRVAAIKEHIGSFAAALDYAQTCLHLGRILGAMTPAIPEPDWLNGEADAFLDLIAAAVLDDRYRLATEQVTSALRDLKAARDVHGTHPVVGAMIHNIERRDVAGYNHSYQHVQRIEQAVRDLDLARRIEAAFGAVAPELADEVAAGIEDRAWDDRFAGWEQAWRFAVADNWLTRRSDAAYRDELWRRRQDADEEILQLLAEAASLRAWTHFFTRLTAQEAAALRAWREAMRSMSKPGGGRPAGLEQLRQEARQYMDRCRDAIPVWIMPRYLVAEMIDAAPERYDFVIVDESSQLGIDSLFLFYISRKMIVVGDDQQISPYGFGIPERSIAELHHRYLEGIPFHNAFSAQSSLYGNAKIRFAQSVVLREHFRCMPEIIQFSNDLCYATSGTPLDPLRTYPVNRLKPLVTRHIPGGWRTGAESATNEAEANAIVAQIMACIADPRYAGRTMGVISLQGEAQAKLIEHKLLQTLEPEIFEQRRLMCGDASAFQGDERHIIFLSMVALPGEPRIAPLSDEQARQRINVAASRAQDQLWLFHSATLDDLSPGCMRHRLLGYMLATARRTAEELRHRFESQFERDVFQMIADRGFRMRTQVCIGDPTSHRYRIDIVIEGLQGRLAVECEGDRWNGPERYEEDLARQRDLERAGWQFVRLRGGEFYRDRHAAMEPVWNALDRLGIRPGGFDDAAEEPPSPASSRCDTEGDEILQGGVRADASMHAAADAGPDTGFDAGLADSNAGPAPAAHPAGAYVADYVAFSGMAGPDPRTAPLGEVIDGLCQIIRTEGPMIAKRAYDVYLHGCGIRRLGNELQGTMNRALSTAVGQGRVICENAPGEGGIVRAMVRLPGAPAVRARRRGPRSVDEIPPSELRAVARRLSAALNLTPGSDEHLRAVIQAMDLPLMLSQVSAMLEADAEPAGAGDSGDRAAE
jgi:very-short-patch-repair endonuclease